MTVNEALRSAILPFVAVCEPDAYNGPEREYCTFVYDDQPDVFAEGLPQSIVHSVILNWYLPYGKDPLEKKQKMCRALWSAGFTYPHVTNISDSVSQGYAFECEWPGGVG